jgi:hypothetical protein
MITIISAKTLRTDNHRPLPTHPFRKKSPFPQATPPLGAIPYPKHATHHSATVRRRTPLHTAINRNLPAAVSCSPPPSPAVGRHPLHAAAHSHRSPLHTASRCLFSTQFAARCRPPHVLKRRTPPPMLKQHKHHQVLPPLAARHQP